MALRWPDPRLPLLVAGRPLITLLGPLRSVLLLNKERAQFDVCAKKAWLRLSVVRVIWKASNGCGLVMALATHFIIKRRENDNIFLKGCGITGWVHKGVAHLPAGHR